MAKGKLLIIDDDTAILTALRMFFAHEGMEVQCCPDGAQGRAALTTGGFDAVLLDLDLPDTDGMSLLQDLRQRGDTTPVIIVSGHDEEYNQLMGLGIGADDYVTKPFSMPLLLSKVRALLRRAGVYSQQHSNILSRGPLSIDRSTYVVTKDDKRLELTAKELALLTHFMEHPGQVFSKSQLYQAVWGDEYADENTVMVYVKRLRDKVEDDSANPRLIVTLRGLGYRFDG